MVVLGADSHLAITVGLWGEAGVTVVVVETGSRQQVHFNGCDVLVK